MKELPALGITMGDPSGIGPEIAVKALTHASIRQECRPVIIGDAGVIAQAAQRIGSKLQLRTLDCVEDAVNQPETLEVYDLKNVALDTLQMGQVSAMAGNAAFEAVKTAIDLALAGRIDAVVTGPINKEALHLAGHPFPGHTEIFAHFTRTPDFTMMLAEGNLRVVHVSTHVSLRQACDCVTRERVLKVIGLANQACLQLGIAHPKVGVAALNPHASDGGLFGSEEREQIIPSIADARAQGIDVEGPVPPDTFFSKAAGGAYDICVAMYHDQGHIPVKLLGFHYDAAQKTWTSVTGINITLGLPIIRVSVDHGTAFDQAGKGTASEASLVCAIEYASRLAANRTKTS
jgi:4-hydroxythreonine-4-phosphate dehydrogenase